MLNHNPRPHPDPNHTTMIRFNQFKVECERVLSLRLEQTNDESQKTLLYKLLTNLLNTFSNCKSKKEIEAFIEQAGYVLAWDRCENIPNTFVEEILKKVGITKTEIQSLMRTAAQFGTDLIIRSSNTEFAQFINRPIRIQRTLDDYQEEVIFSWTKDMSIKATTKFGIVVADAFDSKLGDILANKIKTIIMQHNIFKKELLESVLDARAEETIDLLQDMVRKAAQHLDPDQLYSVKKLKAHLKQGVKVFLLKQRTNPNEHTVALTNAQITEISNIVSIIGEKNIHTERAIQNKRLRKVDLLIPIYMNHDSVWLTGRTKLSTINGKSYLNIIGLEKFDQYGLPEGVLIRDVDGQSYSLPDEYSKFAKNVSYDSWFGISGYFDKLLLISDNNLQHGFGAYDPQKHTLNFPLLGISRFGLCMVIETKKELWVFKEQCNQKFAWLGDNTIPFSSAHHIQISSVIDDIKEGQTHTNITTLQNRLKEYMLKLNSHYALFPPERQQELNKYNLAISAILDFICTASSIDMTFFPKDTTKYTDEAQIAAHHIMESDYIRNTMMDCLPLSTGRHIILAAQQAKAGAIPRSFRVLLKRGTAEYYNTKTQY